MIFLNHIFIIFENPSFYIILAPGHLRDFSLMNSDPYMMITAFIPAMNNTGNLTAKWEVCFLGLWMLAPQWSSWPQAGFLKGMEIFQGPWEWLRTQWNLTDTYGAGTKNDDFTGRQVRWGNPTGAPSPMSGIWSENQMLKLVPLLCEERIWLDCSIKSVQPS